MRNFFVYLIVILLCIASVASMGEYLSGAKAGISTIIYFITTILSLCFIFWSIINGKFRPTNYIFTIISFGLYFLIQSLLSFDVQFTRIAANLVWVIIGIYGYILGVKFAKESKLSIIATVLCCFLLPLFLFESFKFSSATFLDSVKDAYFISLSFFPFVFLINSRVIKNLGILVFVCLAIISLKRSIIIVTLLSTIIFYFLDSAKFWKRGLFIFVFISVASMLIGMQSEGGLTDSIIQRFNNILEDGGSGRDNIYMNILNDISYFDLSDILFGKGFNSVVNLIGVNAHMDILQVMHSFGLVGLIIYLTIYYLSIKAIILHSKLVGINLLGISSIISFIVFVLISNTNCIIIVPPLISPLMFTNSFLIGAIEFENNMKLKRLI